ncbi:MAG: acetate--CoA ligase family protein, partial [Anaerolineae bacterium]|nr:acetate--CoA ligase family protein [Anaerolineae bacterium]
MNLHEYQSKRLFEQHGVPIPHGKVAESPAVARQIAEELGGPVVVKAQVLTGGRGKAGGVKLAKNAEEAEQRAKDILGMNIKGHIVRQVLIDPASNIEKEIYLGITNDRAARQPVIMCSAEGGVDIETVNRTNPDAIIREHIDPLLGLRSYQINALASGIELPYELWRQFQQIAAGLYDCYRAND